MTKVRGTTSPLDEPTQAPYTDVDWLAYEAWTDRYQYRRNRSNWHTGCEQSTGVAFELRDPTAAVEIDSVAAEFFLAHSYKAQATKEDGPPGPADADEEFSTGGVCHQLDADDALRYHERRLDVGEDGTVVGVVEYGSWPGSSLTIESENSRSGLLAQFLDPPMVVAVERDPSASWKLLRPALPPLLGAISLLGAAVEFYQYLPSIQ